MIINFARGHPNVDLLPVNAMKEALNLVQEQGDLVSYLNYPHEDNGNSELLRELSLFLNKHTALDDLGQEFMEASAAENETNHWNDDSAPTNRSTAKTDFFMTHGVSHAMDLLCSTLTEPGHVVAIEVPTYFLVARIFENHSLTTQPLPMKHTLEDGIIIDVMKLQENLDNGIQAVPNMLYTIPTHHNPTASTLPIADRIHLAKLAKQYGIIVVADEVYHLLDWRHHHLTARQDEKQKEFDAASAATKTIPNRPARMAVIGAAVAAATTASSSSSSALAKPCSTVATSYVTNSAANTDPSGSVAAAFTPSAMLPTSKPDRRFGGSCLSVSSFTKIFCPGIRCGWVEGPPDIIEALCQYGYIQSQGGCVPFVGELMRCALSSGLATKVLLSLQGAYYERSQLLCRILLEGNDDDDDNTHNDGSNDSLRICTKPLGGYFVWIKLPSGVKALDFAAYCSLESGSGGVKILPGPSCDPFDIAADDSDDYTMHASASAQGTDFVSNHVRLCFADLSLHELEHGARRLRELLHEYLQVRVS